MSASKREGTFESGPPTPLKVEGSFKGPSRSLQRFPPSKPPFEGTFEGFRPLKGTLQLADKKMMSVDFCA